MVVATRGGIALLFLIVLPAALAHAFLLFPSMILLLHPIGRTIYRRASGFIQAQWFILVSFILEKYCGVKYVFTGDVTMTRDWISERKFVISNHRTRLDWFFLWPLGLRMGWLDSLKIVLKSGLRSLPIFGWSMQNFRFMFLNRVWAKDKHSMTRLMQYSIRQGDPMTMLIFPEGTDLHKDAIAASKVFAAQLGAPEYKYVLHPRTTGTHHILQHSRQQFDGFYDVTIAYHDYKEGERPSEASIIGNRMPLQIHVHVNRFDMKDVPSDGNGVETFVRQRFAEKEKRLTSFYEGSKSFAGQPLFAADHDISLATIINIIYHIAVAYIGVRVLVTRIGWLYLILVWIINVIMTKYGPGWDGLELSRYDASWQPPADEPLSSSIAPVEGADTKKAQ